VNVDNDKYVAAMLTDLGAVVQVCTSLHDAEIASIPTGMTILAARIPIDVDVDGDDVDSVTLVVKGFGVVGMLCPEPVRPSFFDRFAEAHRGRVEPSQLCESIIRASARDKSSRGLRQGAA